MPLNTRIIRDGEPLKLRWSGFHVAAMAVAASVDDPSLGKSIFEDKTLDRPDFEYGPTVPANPEWAGADQSRYPEVPCPISPRDAFEIGSYPMLGLTPLNDRRYVLKREHAFVDVTNGEVLRLLPGDELVAFRD
jgi:hypothetical protein